MNIKHWMATAALIALAGCGGGGGGGSSSITISGTVATGAAMANAAISLLCNSGGAATTATAGPDGKYTMTIPASCTAPYMLKASAGGITLYAFADAAGNINITPFTEIAAGVATKGNTQAEYAAVLAASKKVADFWSTSTGQAVRAEVQAKLAPLGISFAGLTDFLHAAFEAKAGDSLDDALEKLRAARGNLPLSSIVERVAQAGGSPMDKPWLTLFGPGATSRTTRAGSCILDARNGNGAVDVAEATITLATSGDKLVLTMSGGGLAGQPSIEVGGEGSRFTLYYPAGTGAGRHVGISAARGNEKIEAVESAGHVLFSYQGTAGVLACSTLTQRLAPESLHAFDIPARVGSLVGSEKNVTSPTNGCSLNASPSTTYTYAVSPVGEITLNGQDFTGFTPAGSAAPAYADGFNWTTSERQPSVTIGSYGNPVMSLWRGIYGFEHGCRGVDS